MEESAVRRRSIIRRRGGGGACDATRTSLPRSWSKRWWKKKKKKEEGKKRRRDASLAVSVWLALGFSWREIDTPLTREILTLFPLSHSKETEEILVRCDIDFCSFFTQFCKCRKFLGNVCTCCFFLCNNGLLQLKVCTYIKWSGWYSDFNRELVLLRRLGFFFNLVVYFQCVWTFLVSRRHFCKKNWPLAKYTLHRVSLLIRTRGTWDPNGIRV